MDTEIIAKGLCHEMNEEYKTKLKEQHNRIQKAEIICDFLQENSERILPILLLILDDNGMKKVSDRLQSYQTIKGKPLCKIRIRTCRTRRCFDPKI